MTVTETTQEARPEHIRAVPVRHPGRWVATVVVVILAAMFIHMVATNNAFDWSFIGDNALRHPVLVGAKNTLVLTVLAMLIGVALGIVPPTGNRTVAVIKDTALVTSVLMIGRNFLGRRFARGTQRGGGASPRMRLMSIGVRHGKGGGG
jgi:hypothetical protein